MIVGLVGHLYRNKMFKVLRVFDKDFIISLLKDDKESFGVDDKWQPLSEFPNMYFLVVTVFNKPAALLVFNHLQSDIADSHICIFKEFRTKDSHVLTKLALEWMRENTPVRRFIAFISSDKSQVKSYAKKCNFKVVGKLVDMDILEG